MRYLTLAVILMSCGEDNTPTTATVPPIAKKIKVGISTTADVIEVLGQPDENYMNSYMRFSKVCFDAVVSCHVTFFNGILDNYDGINLQYIDQK